MHLANTGYLTNTTLGIMRLCDSRLKNVISLPVFLKGLRKFSSRGLIDGLTVRNWEQDYSAVPIMDLKTYRDKFLAHQANEVSRDRLGNDWSFDSRLIDVCEERIVKLTHRMSQTLLDDTNWPLIIEPSFAWGHIDLPLVPKVLKRRMQEIWNERERQMGEWVGVIRRRPD